MHSVKSLHKGWFSHVFCLLLLFSFRRPVDEALDHPYMASLHDVTDEPECHAPYTFDSEHPIITDEDVRRFINQEAQAMFSQIPAEYGA